MSAVYHCAYDARESKEVRGEQDKIEIESFSEPDRSVTQEGKEGSKWKCAVGCEVVIKNVYTVGSGDI
ncbi:hypothetical protein HDR58_00765 [bacterium]|nr:hypothetical protein [bacterium]